MKETGVLFKPEMVLAILKGTKTQTRRVIKKQPGSGAHSACVSNVGQPWHWIFGHNGNACHSVKCPYGTPGDVIWVREPWRTWGGSDWIKPSDLPENALIRYEADAAFLNYDAPGYLTAPPKDYPTNPGGLGKLRPAMFMPGRFARLKLTITTVRVEQLRDISLNDCIAEGIAQPRHRHGNQSPKESYRSLWESINGAESWNANPWVFAVTFKATLAWPVQEFE